MSEVNCPSCGHENRDGAAFCGGCGQSLAGEQRCPQCDSPNPAAQRFCDSCGNSLIATNASQETRDPRSYTPKHLADKILQSKSALEGERKQVTVLFADVKGSTELAEELARWAGPAGDDRSFERELREAHRLYTEIGATGHAERLAQELAS